jgi:PKD repeat protein/photosystem II stability/assembly factor-like uncharacterized protein
MKKLSLNVFLFLLPLSLFSQKYLDLMNREKVNFFEVQREAEKYFQNRDQGKGTGYKQYKRWEYLKRKEIDDQGFLISDRQVWNEIQAFKGNELAQGRLTLGGDWKPLGPSSWNRTSGWNPGVGRVVCIAVEPVSQNLIYIGSPTGGLWKSTNAGSTWNVLTDDMPVMDVWSVSIDPNDTSKIFMGTSGGGVMKSIDGGQNWSNLPGTGGTVRRILISNSNSNLVFAASSSGIWRSTNGGINWTKVHFSSVEDMDFKPGNENVVLATGNGFYRSTNNGVSFSTVSVSGSNGQRMKLAVTPADSNYVYIIQKSGSIFGSVFRSVNGGTSFSTRISYQGTGTGTNFLGYSTTGNDASGQAWRDMAIAVSKTDKDEVHIAGIALWKSTNGGSSFFVSTAWFLPNSIGYVHADVEVLQFVGNILYTGSDGGIYKSTDNAANFTDLTDGIGIRQFYRIGGSQLDSNVVSGGSQDNGTSVMRSASRSWVDWLGADGMESFVDISNANILYGTSQFGSMYKSINQGNSRFGISKPTGVGSGSWVTPFESDPQVATTIYVGFDELYKNANGGSGGASAWSAISNLNFGNLDEIALAPSDNQTIYIADGSTIYRTTNGGTNWTNISSGVSGVVNYISVDPNDPQRVALAVSGSGKVLLSTNGGSNWTSLASGLPGIAANCVLLDHTTENGIYVGMQGGVYFRNNSQPGWASFMVGLPLVRVYELEIQLQAQKIRAATYGRGLWESPIFNAGNSAPLANLLADKTDPVVGDTVFFSDISAGSPTSWNWSFPGGNPLSSTIQNPFVIYSSEGVYDVSLTVTNAFGSDSTTKTAYVNVKPYCTSSANNSIDSYIQSFQFGGINQNDPSCATYSDLTNLVAQVDRGNSYTVSVTTSDCDGGSSFSKGFNLYIDWNSDNVFDEANELVFSSPIQASGTFSTSITIPLTAVLGTTGLRIVCSESAPILACGLYNWGETEDYKVNIGDTLVSCPTVQIDTAFRSFISCNIDSIINLSGGIPTGGTFSGNFVSAGQFNIQNAGAGTHIFYYNYDDGLGCVGSDSGSITINASPDISFSSDGVNSLTGDSLFACITNPATPNLPLFYLVNNMGSLTAPVLGDWTSLSGGFIFPDNNRPPAISSQYFAIADSTISRVQISVDDAKGCTSLDTLTVFLDKYPLTGIQFLQNQVCFGDTVTAQFNSLPAQLFNHSVIREGPGPQGVVYISGSPEIKNSFEIIPGSSLTNPIANLTSPTWFIYKWQFTDGGGCTSVKMDSILVNPKPQINLLALPNDTICSGELVTLSASMNSPSIAQRYYWSTSSQDSLSTVVVSPLISTLYTVYVKDINACLSVPSNITITVGNSPIVSLGNFGTVCLTSGSLALTGGTPIGGSYSGPGVSGNLFDPIIAGPGIHTIIYTYDPGCLGSDSSTIAVLAPPSVSQTNLPGLCMNAGSIALSGGSPLGGNYSGPGVSAGNFDPSIAGVGIHQFIYFYSDSNNCSGQDTGTIQVFPVPSVSHPSISGLCPEDPSFALIGGIPAGGNYSGPGVSGNQFSPTLAGPGIHNLLYSYTDVNSCSESASFVVPVFNSAVAGFSYSSLGLQMSFFDSSTNAASWSWDFGDGGISPGQNPFHTYSIPGTYTVCLDIQTISGCVDQDCKDIPIELVGLSGNLSGEQIRVFPNPFSNDLNIRMDFDHESIDGKLIDILGRKFVDFRIEAGVREFNVPIPVLSPGTYILYLKSGEERVRIPIEKK